MEMEVVLNTFNRFLLKNGVLDQEGINYLKKSTLNFAPNNRQYINGNFEEKIILKLSEYLKITYRDHRAHNLSSSLYEKYISQDDEKIVKIIRKLMIIYKSSIIKLSSKNFSRWKLISHKLKFTPSNVPSVYKKKKFQDTPLVISDERNYLTNNTNRNLKSDSDSEKKFYNESTKHETLKRTPDQTLENQKYIFDKDTPVTTERKETNIVNNIISVNKAENFSICDKINNKPVHDRLYKDKARRDLILNENAKNFRQDEVKDCTFVPKINITTTPRNSSVNKNEYSTTPTHKKSKSKNSDPCYIQLYENRKDKEKNIRQLSIDKEKRMNKIYTFEPSINTNFKLKRLSSDFKERQKMYDNSKSKNLKKIKEEIERSTPAPKNNSVSCNKSNTSNLNISTDKIIEYQKKKQENLKKIEEEMMNEQGITFMPKLNENVNCINSSIYDRNDEFARNKSIKLRSYSSKEDIECTFSPKVNSNSKLIADSTEPSSVGERLFQYQQKYLQNAEIKKEIYKENYSFKPEINVNTYEILKQRDAIMEEIKSKYNMDKSIPDLSPTNNNIPRSDVNLMNEIVENPYENDSDERDTSGRSKDPKSKKNFNEDIKIDNQEKDDQDSGFGKDRSKSLKLISAYKMNNLSDSKLLEIANQYITTDESLEKFQLRLREKYKKSRSEQNDNLITKDILKYNQSFNQVQSAMNSGTSTNPNNLPQNIDKPPINKNDKKKQIRSNLPTKNIATKFDYYDMIQS